MEPNGSRPWSPRGWPCGKTEGHACRPVEEGWAKGRDEEARVETPTGMEKPGDDRVGLSGWQSSLSMELLPVVLDGKLDDAVIL